MGKSVFKLVSELKSASIEIGACVEEAEDIEAAIELCRRLTDAGRIHMDELFPVAVKLSMPAGFWNARYIDADTRHCIGGVCSFGDSPITPFNIAVDIEGQEFLSGGKFEKIQVLPTVDKGVLELEMTFIPRN